MNPAELVAGAVGNAERDVWAAAEEGCLETQEQELEYV